MEAPRRTLWPALDEPVLLALLARSPTHGYEVFKKLEGFFGDAVRKSHVYRALNDLEDHGLARSSTENGEGRAKRVYELTDGGHARLADYGRLSEDLGGLLDSIFSGNEDHGGPSGNPEPRTRSNRSRTEANPLPPGAWVQQVLEVLPEDPAVEAPHARFEVSRDPSQGAWSLEVRAHEPGGYDGQEACPLTFLYLATIRLLFDPPG